MFPLYVSTYGKSSISFKIIANLMEICRTLMLLQKAKTQIRLDIMLVLLAPELAASKMAATMLTHS
jgi:hypothetical protein